MANFIYGLVGAVVTLLLFGGGFYCGARFAHPVAKPAHPTTPERLLTVDETKLSPEDLERRRTLEAEQDAFRAMLGYNPDMVYGVGKALDELKKEE